MGTHNNSLKNIAQGEQSNLAGGMLDAIKSGAVRGFREAARSFFLPIRLGWQLSQLLVLRLRPITEPMLAAALMFAVLLLGFAAQALLSRFSL